MEYKVATATMLGVSTGVEPNFAFSYTRRTVSLNKEETYYQIDSDIVKQYKSIWGDCDNKDLPKFFIASHQVYPSSRLLVQAALQRWIDASISSTLNLKEETTVEEVADIYMKAWKYGLKGITIWRDNCQRQGILSTKKEEKSEKQAYLKIDETSPIQLEAVHELKRGEISNVPCLDCIETISRKDLGQVLHGDTYKYQTACGSLYITINKDENGNIVEIFTNSSKNGTCKANLNGETRLASLALRAGVRTEEVIDTLKSIQCQSCAFAKARGNKIDGTSCPDIIAKCIKQSYTVKQVVNNPISNITFKKESIIDQNSNKCPECGKELIHSGGCVQCECGYSKCN